MANFVSEDRDVLKSSYENLTKTRKERWFGAEGEGILKRAKGFGSQVLESLQIMSEYSEYATRIGVYTMTRDALAEQRADGKATWEDKRKAAFVSRDATIDFARAGRSGRDVNQKIAFFNAAIQGIDRTCRTFDYKKLKKFGGNEESQKELFNAVFRLAMTSVIPAMVLFFFNHDKDWYKEVAEYEKDNNWLLPGGKFKVPKGMDFGLRLMTTLTDNYLDWLVDNKPFEAAALKKTVMDAAPGLMPTLMTPMIENWANYSFFRDAPIVPMRMQKLPEHMQHDAYTSPIAKYIGEITGFSPKKIDHLISGYFGFMGRLFTGGVDLTAENAPMLRRFMFDPMKNPKSVRDYYNAYDEQAKLYEEYKSTKKKPADFDPKLWARLKKVKPQMQKISKQERGIISNEKISVDDKRNKLRELEKKRLAIIDRAMGAK